MITCSKQKSQKQSQPDEGGQKGKSMSDEEIKEIDKKIIHVLWTIFISFMTALITACLVIKLAGL